MFNVVQENIYVSILTEMLIWKATENDLTSVELGQNFDLIKVNNSHSIYCLSDELELIKYLGV